MNYLKIPTRNEVLENEKAYLEKKHACGKGIRGKGMFFYRFEKVEAASVSYEIDIVPKSMDGEIFEVDGWNYLFSTKIPFSKYQKDYYFSTASKNTFEIDEYARLDFYQSRSFAKSNASICYALLLVSGFFALHFEIPSLVLNILFLPYLLCLPLFFHSYNAFSKLDAQRICLVRKLGKLPDDFGSLWYFVTLPKGFSLSEAELKLKLKLLGRVRMINRRKFCIKSNLSQKQLHELIGESVSIPTDKIIVANQLGLGGILKAEHY